MPRGPKGQKRPADVIGKAVKAIRIATGEQQQTLGADDGKDPAAKSLGARGGRARAKALSPRQRAEIAQVAARARWNKKA
jgi:hypothetical protein